MPREGHPVIGFLQLVCIVVIFVAAGKMCSNSRKEEPDSRTYYSSIEIVSEDTKHNVPIPSGVLFRYYGGAEIRNLTTNTVYVKSRVFQVPEE